MKMVMKFLRNRLASPAVAALCEALEEDHNTWRNDEILIAHRSTRFAIILPTKDSELWVMNHLGEEAIELDKFERFALSCSVNDWLDAENYNNWVRSLLTDAERFAV